MGNKNLRKYDTVTTARSATYTSALPHVRILVRICHAYVICSGEEPLLTLKENTTKESLPKLKENTNKKYC